MTLGALHLLRQPVPLAVVVSVAALAAGSAWVVQGWRGDAKLQACRAGVATERAAAAEEALDQLQLAARAVDAAASAAAAAGQRAARATDAARLRWQQEIAAQPLPADCRRDGARAAALRGAIERTTDFPTVPRSTP